MSEKTAPQRTRRKPVSIACESCRLARTKCDYQSPKCRHCKQKNLDCIRLDAHVPALIQQIQHLVGKVHDLEGRVNQTPLSLEAADSPTAARESQPPLPFTTRPEPASEAVGSSPPARPPLLDFSAERYASRVAVLFGRESHPAVISHPITFSLEATTQVVSAKNICLSRNLQDYYVRLYWQRIHRTLPVINKTTFDAHYKCLWEQTQPDQPCRSSYVVDIVLALALQLEYSSKPQDPSPTNADTVPESSQQDSLRRTAYSFYDACTTALNQEFESPSLSALQAYILVVVFLRNEQRHNSAYQILGLAIRAANIMRLDQQPRSAASPEDLSVRDQIADFLFCFDVQQYLEFGRPYGILDSSTKRHVPIGHSNTRCFWSYYSELLSITKSAYFALRTDAYSLDVDQFPSVEILEQLKSATPEFVAGVDHWARRVPPKFLFERHFPASPFCTDAPLEMDADQPLWRLRQCLLLELSYHWVLMNVLRWYIIPESGGTNQVLGSTSISFSSYAQRAVEHGIAIIQIIHQAHNETEAIPGWQDSQLKQWDATLTLLSSILRQSSEQISAKTLDALLKSKIIFDALGTRFTITAANTIREILSLDRTKTVGERSSGLSQISGVSPAPSSLLDCSNMRVDFSGEFFVDDCFRNFNVPSDMDFMAMQMPEPPDSPII